MGYCVAPNCKSQSSKGIRMFRFPTDKNRRAKWVQNCRRENWKPTDSSKLCEKLFLRKITWGKSHESPLPLHFEESQYELNRADGRKLLKRSAIPTIFKVPNPPKLLSCRRKPPRQRILLSTSNENEITHKPPDPMEENCVENESNPEAAQSTEKLKEEISELKEKLAAMEKRVNTFLKPDQIRYLQRVGKTNPYTWTNQTIRHALQIKCAVGNKGYEFLRSIDYPLPSSRTLSRRIEACRFSQGIQYDIIEWLGIKLQSCDDQSKLCVLLLDEMQLRPYVEYDKGLKRYVGFVSGEFSNSDEVEIATHALVFVVRGLTLHWKQVVAYALTGTSTNPHKLWNFMKQLIMCLYSQGVLVKCISSDMGSNNTCMWGVVGVHSIRNHVNCKISHPSKPDENLYFVPDVSHILKNIRNCLLSQDITLPDDIVSEKKLKSKVVSLKHVEHLLELQEVGGPVLVPNLTKKVVNPSAFEKMRVPIARSLFSSKVSSALLFCISTKLMSEDATATSWFIEQVSAWYEIMQCRDKSGALSENSIEQLSHLSCMLQWFLRLSFNGKRHWKPIQTGLQLSTTTAMELCKELTSRSLIEYLLTSRLSTDCVENFFSQVRNTGDNHPTPVKLRNVIRLISVAQYSHVPCSSSYDIDDDQYYLEFFSRTKNIKETAEDRFPSNDDRLPNDVNINIVQKAGLYHLAGWVVHKLIRVSQEITCDTCIKGIAMSEPSSELPHEWTTMISKGNLIHPTDAAFKILQHAEITFQKYSAHLLNEENVKEKILKIMLESLAYKLNFACKHDITKSVIFMYLSIRLHIFAEDFNKKNACKTMYGSKSSFMRTSADTYRKI